MSLPIHLGQTEQVGAGRVAVTEVCQDYTPEGIKGTITLQFWGDIFTGNSPLAPNHLGIPLVTAEVPKPTTAPLQHLLQPFARKITA